MALKQLKCTFAILPLQTLFSRRNLLFPGNVSWLPPSSPSEVSRICEVQLRGLPGSPPSPPPCGKTKLREIYLLGQVKVTKCKLAYSFLQTVPRGGLLQGGEEPIDQGNDSGGLTEEASKKEVSCFYSLLRLVQPVKLRREGASGGGALPHLPGRQRREFCKAGGVLHSSTGHLLSAYCVPAKRFLPVLSSSLLPNSQRPSLQSGETVYLGSWGLSWNLQVHQRPLPRSPLPHFIKVQVLCCGG